MKKYYIMYGNFFLDNFESDIDAINTDLIKYFVFRSYPKDYGDSFKKEEAEFLIEKLSTLGFNKDMFRLEEYEPEEL